MSTSYGADASPSQIRSLLGHILRKNMEAAQRGDDKIPVCIWGTAGIGKTQVVKDLAKDLKIESEPGQVHYPEVVHVPLAQISEEGDLLGLPIEVSKGDGGLRTTAYAPPAWWPTKSTPTILLIDDFNRADPRILKAIMQILQDSKSLAASLPRNTCIVLTGNPPNSNDQYMVSEIDKAIMTRMVHVHMKFNKSDWAIWAKGSGIDDRVISFVLWYPEMCDGTKGERTNPRSIAQFARLIVGVETTDPLMGLICHSALDPEVASSFIAFVGQNYALLPDPKDLVKNGPKVWESSFEKLKGTDKSARIRLDTIGVMATRLLTYLIFEEDTLAGKELGNVIDILTQGQDWFPREIFAIFTSELRARNPGLWERINKMDQDEARGEKRRSLLTILRNVTYA